MQNQSNVHTLSDPRERMYSAALDVAVSKIRSNLPALIESPASWGFAVNGDYSKRDEAFAHIDNWTTSFFTGMALIAHAQTKEDGWIVQLERLSGIYGDKISKHAVDTMHDLGFLYSLYSVGLYRLTGKDEHREIGLTAARLLASRYQPEGGYIRAWGPMDDQGGDYPGLAIIDSLMNLPLLYWAAKESGDRGLHDIAVSHTNTTLDHFVRPDGSVFHAYRFDPASGDPVGGDNYCGRSVSSHWARGSAWAMFGLALGYRHTGDIRYLDGALSVAAAFVSKLDGEGIPVWDFALEEGEEPLLDSSAAAIAVCAIQELEKHEAASASLQAAKVRMLESLCSEDFCDASPDCRGLLRLAQVGDGLGRARSVYASWGDYFFMQALAEECGQSVDFW